MPQPVKKNIKAKPKPKPKPSTRSGRIKAARERAKRGHEYGTSKLEERFAKEFLDKAGFDYVYQYKVESIGRYFDFKIKDVPIFFEIDGDYYHAYGKLYEEMSPMQKKNYKVDQIKNDYCSRNGFKLYRIWEHDINNNPAKVIKFLRELKKSFKKG